MNIIIDAFNLIYKIPDIVEFMYTGELAKATNGLVNMLNLYAKGIKKIPINYRLGSNFTIMVDGKKQQGLDIKEERVKNVKIYYSLDLSADHLIKSYVRKSKNPKSLIIITSDKQIISHIKRYGSKNRSSEEFSEILIKGLEAINKKVEIRPEVDANLKLDENEVEYWKKIFEEK